jgi:hypothetical protein
MRREEHDRLSESVRSALELAGLGQAQWVSIGQEAPGFGDCTVTFRLGHLIFRVVRDRGEFVDLAAASRPGPFLQYDDVEIAMGWRSVEEVLAKKGPEALDRVFERIRARLSELDTAFSDEQVLLTEAKVRRAAQARGAAFVASLDQD